MNTITMKLANPALPGNPVVIYQGVSTKLTVILTNDTGADISMTKDSTLEILFPQFFTSDQVENMEITKISVAGWTPSFDSSGPGWVLSWGNDTGEWEKGDTLGFSIGNVTTNANPQTDSLEITPNQLSGPNIPLQISASISLETQPAPGNANLQDVLEVEAVQGGMVYVSQDDTSLANTVYLNLKNIGSTPLYIGTGKNVGTPKVTVRFVYGTTSGSLAPGDKAHATDPGSAWLISGTVDIDQTGKWFVRNPRTTDQANTPSWDLKPASTNKEVIGVGDRANVMFAFSNIISFTPPGPTQMYVHFSGFMKDDTTPYNDTVFVVGLNKQNAPNPGVVGIYCRADSISVNSTKQNVAIPLIWSMFGVGSVKLSFHVPGVPSLPEAKYSYGTGSAALTYDRQATAITGILQSQLLTIYCWAYADAAWQQLLNKMECSVPLIFPPVINAFTIQSANTAPPYSYAFQLNWDIAGETSFQISADDGSGPQVLPIPQTVSSYVVRPEAPQTTYTLSVFGNSFNNS